jgi:hypothetical protein
LAKQQPESRPVAHGWRPGGDPSAPEVRALEREVFERALDYPADRVVTAPRFNEDYEMTEAVIDHVREVRRLLEFRIWRRRNAAQPVAFQAAVEAMIRTVPNIGYGGSGPTRGAAVCQAAVFLAANRERMWRLAV